MALLSASLHVSVERFHDQVQLDGNNVDPRQEEYDRQTDHEILPRSHVRRFPMGVRILMSDVLAGRYASVL